VVIHKTMKKIGLIVFGLILPLILWEIGLRIVGGSFLFSQKMRNLAHLFETGTYRVLCLGESTTQNQWPRPLQTELNRLNIGIRFKVIDQGVGGVNTDIILSNLDASLAAYKPDMVIVMMGINDGEWVWTNPVADESARGLRMFLKNMRVNKVARYVIGGIINGRVFGGRAVSTREEKLAAPVFTQRGNRFEDDILGADAHVISSDIEKIDPSERLSVEQIQADPFGSNGYIKLGDLYYGAKQYDNAIKVYRTWLKNDPRNPLGYIKLGKTYQQRGEYDKAEMAFRAGIQANPRFGQLYLRLGNLYVQMREYAMAENAFRMAIRQDPRNLEGYIELGQLYIRMGRPIEAEETFRRGVGIAPDNELGYLELMKLYNRRGESEKAIKMAEARDTVSPGDARRYSVLGDIYRDNGDYEKAERAFVAAINSVPRNTEHFMKLGEFYEYRSDFYKAGKIYEMVIKLEPRHEQGYWNLAHSYMQRGEYAKAEGLLKRKMELIPINAWDYIEWGNICQLQGDYEKAIKMYEMSIRLDPKATQGYVKMADVYHKQKKYREAEDILKKEYDGMADAPEMSAESAARPRKSYLRSSTIRNYRRLKDAIMKRGIRFVCMQYPLRDIGPLKEVLGSEDGIIYVENKTNFENELVKRGFTDLFCDAFAGDFGHCTPLGNQVIAQNLAGVVMREVFSEKRGDSPPAVSN